MKALTESVPELETAPVNAIPRILLACALLTGAGCAGPGTVSPAPAATTSAPGFGGTDRSWIEINIAMDEELLPLLDLVGEDSDLFDIAAQVREFTEAELTELRRLSGEAGLPAENQHKGMPMPGMVMPSQVAAAAGLRGKEFDTVLREHLRAHLEQSQKLAASERSAGSEPRTIALAVRISETRQSALNLL
jgi:hypothetical protein